MIAFDVETMSLPDEQLALLKPEFRPAANLKDPEKIRASIAEKEASWKANAALDAKTARIMAIGTLDESGENRAFFGENERGILEAFWELWAQGDEFIGFACHNFDCKMIWQRSILTGVTPCRHFYEGRYPSKRIIDLQSVWNCHDRDISGQSLDAVCRALGIGAKSGNGSQFGEMWQRDPKEALFYLSHDLELSWALGVRLGVVSGTVPF